MQNKVEFTSFEFIQMYSDLKKNNIKLDEVDGSGCYVLLNKSKNKNYVGQSVNVLRRINNHLNGKGNGDVYADLKYGDMFKIIIVKCNVDELNVIEKNLISEYDAFSKGYNRNEGVGKGY